jgi:hypothetical protein
MKIFGAFFVLCGFWVAFGGLGLLFWLGERYGGGLSDSWIPAIIFFGGAPVVLGVAAGVWAIGAAIFDGEF